MFQSMTLKNQPTGRPSPDDPVFLSELSELDRGLSGPSRAELPPLITIPGQRPLLDLFPVFFPDAESRNNLPQAPPMAGELPLAAREPPHMPTAPLTYEPFYGLRERPFTLGPDAKFLYHSAAHDRAAQEILGAIGRRDSLVVVTGEFGMGKTTLCQTILEELDRRTLTSFVTEPFVSIEELLKTLLVDFGVMSSERFVRGRLDHASQRELADALRHFLLSLGEIGAFAVVIIDDAHNLAIQVLEELRVLVGEPLIQLILVGEPGLLATLRRPALEPVMRHLSRQSTLTGLTRDEVGHYVFHRLGVAGNPHVDLEQAALWHVYEVSRGIPRRVNLVCDRALAEGQRLSISVIDQPIINAAAKAVGLAASPSKKTDLYRGLLIALTLTMLAIGGAAAAGFVFQDEVASLILRWQGGPR